MTARIGRMVRCFKIPKTIVSHCTRTASRGSTGFRSTTTGSLGSIRHTVSELLLFQNLKKFQNAAQISGALVPKYVLHN